MHFRTIEALAAAIEAVKQDTVAAINVENFAGAMRALAELRAPVDAFFEKVTVTESEVIKGVYLVDPVVHGDDRGYFVETLRCSEWNRHDGRTQRKSRRLKLLNRR
mgnify:CR=1 FL=1